MSGLPIGHYLHSASVGYAYGKMVANTGDQPVDFEFLEANPAFESLLSVKPSSLSGPHGPESESRFFGEYREWAQRFAEVARTGRNAEYEVWSAPQGKWFRLALSCPEPGSFVVLSTDITSLKRAPSQGRDGVETDKRRYYHAFLSTSQPILITDREGHIVSVNRSFVDMYGFSEEELIGKTPKLLNPGREVYENLGVNVFEYEAKFRDLWTSVLDPSVGTWQGEMINRTRKGALLWVNLVVNAVRDESGALQSLVGLPIDITGSRESGIKNRIQLYRTMAALAELRDDDTGNHLKRVGLFAKLLARSMGLREKYCDDIELFAPLHDIGKVGILDSILRAPRPLSDDEFEVMKTHAVLGHNIMKGKSEFEMAAAITLCHHERYDGTGYPHGLEGKHIPLSAQITAVSDVYDALRARRPYKDPWSHERAVRHFQENTGTQFDPDVVLAFLKIHGRFDAVFRELNDYP